MSDRDALFQAILAARDDDAARLVYADWLDEHGDPERAEFIRVQCRLARLPFYDRAYPTLQREAAGLYVRHIAEWPFRWLPASQKFRRGFVEDVELPADLYVRHRERLFGQTPLQTVHFTEVIFDASWQWDTVASLKGIELPGGFHGLYDTVFQGAPPLPRLEWLRVPNNSFTVRFLHTIECASLEALELTVPLVGGIDPTVVLASADLRTIQSLSFVAEERTVYQDRLRAPGARVIAQAGLTGLHRLELAGHAVGDAGLAHLSQSPDLARLTDLRLARNEIGVIGSVGIEELCAHLRQLRVLDLSGNPLGVTGVRELAAWPGLRTLRALDLSNCGLSVDAVRPLASSQHLHDDLALFVEGNQFNPTELFRSDLLHPSASVS